MNNVLLQGIVGSTAYGLAGPGSDVDRLGVFAEPTEVILGLFQPNQSVVTTDPDVTLHEVYKYCKLALGCNPTVLELMWLPLGLYEVASDLGVELIEIRNAFLSAKRVRDAYLGYATQQFLRLERRGDGSFSADTRKRTAKHARHLMRLCYQGWMLYRGAGLIIRLDDDLIAEIREFGEDVAAGNVDRAKQVIANYEEAFDGLRPGLPEKPNELVVQQWLLKVRETFL